MVRERGGEALGLTWDVRDAAAAKQAHAEAAKELGPVEAVVANAAIVDRIAPAEKLSEEGWRNEIDVNLTGAFLSIQPALESMRERGRGRIVAISSIAATVAFFCSDAAAYITGVWLPVDGGIGLSNLTLGSDR
jgi:NAD(P)-dependent dehydrogenase (short-subunit alcohol dehydrogenase family)